MQQPYNIYMKKILIGLIIITFYNCSTTKTTNSLNTEIVYDYSGKVDNEQLIYIQKKVKQVIIKVGMHQWIHLELKIRI